MGRISRGGKTMGRIIRVWLMSQKEPRFEPHPLEP